MQDHLTLPSAGAYRLLNARIPGCLLGEDGDLVDTDLGIAHGRIDPNARGPEIDLRGGILFPAFVDMHTHLDKGHIWPRSPNPDGTFMGALTTVGRDREARWRAGDVRARMDFALRCAWAHGTRAIRTHIDSIPPQDDISWPVFGEVQADWAGRIDLQAACLVSIESILAEGAPAYEHTADLVAATRGGVLGCVTYPVEGIADRLRYLFRLATNRGLPVDFHVDETGDPAAATLRSIAEVVIETGFDAPVTVGHCCSLAVQPGDEADRTMDLVAQAGLNVVSLPMCNLYLQDRVPGRTPRWRGITLVHELKARGVNVSFASDNTRDPFYAYGDLDMVEVLREATRIGHLDHSGTDWPCAVIANPAAAAGFAAPSLAPGAAADLVLFRARTWTELLSRPQSDRVVIRAGRAIDRALPEYSDLDHLMDCP